MNKQQIKKLARERLVYLHYALEEFIKAFLGDPICHGRMQHLGGDRWRNPWHVRWWNPASWVAWSRVMCCGDRCGSYYYRRSHKVSQSARYGPGGLRLPNSQQRPSERCPPAP